MFGQEGRSYPSILLLALIGILSCILKVFPFTAKASEAIGLQKSPLFKVEGPEVQAEDPLLQFKSGGHILGFKADRMYMVGLGYALIEEFVDALKVNPLSDEGGERGNGNKREAPPFKKVVYPDLWRGITAVYKAAGGGLAESTYVIEPGADVDRIRLRYNAGMEMQGDGSLRFSHPTQKGYFTKSAPIGWQEIGGKRVPVEVRFKEYGGNTVGFKVGEYNPLYALNIAPIYKWHTFYGSFGGPGDDHGFAIATDGAGDVYVTGNSGATWQGDGDTNPIHSYSGGGACDTGSCNSDIVIVKLNSSGQYQWHTFYGGGGYSYDVGHGIAVDGSGNVYVTGWSTGTWQGDGGADPLHAYSGDWDIVVLKLNSSGQYQWHAFYGYANYDGGYGIAVDGSGNVYVSGDCSYSWEEWSMPTPLHAHSGGVDTIVLKLSSNGQYQWHTFYGCATSDAGNGIAVDGSGNVYVVGARCWQGDEGAAPLHDGGNIQILKLNSSGQYQWHTFYGDESTYGIGGRGIAVDGNGNVYVTGNSGGSWQGDGGANPLHAYSDGESDIVILKLNSSGQYQWHTFYGSAYYCGISDAYERGNQIAVDGSGNVYVTGANCGTWQGDGDANPVHAYSGYGDTVVLKLNSSGQYQWHTFYGSGRGDGGYGIAVDGNGNVHVTGYSDGNWHGDGNTNPLHAYSGEDIVVLKLDSSGQYQWHTFYGAFGGKGSDVSYGMAVDGSGNVYVTGASSETWEGDGGATPLHAGSWGGGIFVLKLNSSGQYQWHTFYGAGTWDYGYGIALDGAGNVYVTGESSTGWQGDGGASPLHGGGGIVILKLNSSGQYQWHTFYGSYYDRGFDIAVDGSSNVYVTGSGGAWQGDGGATPLHAHSGSDDIVVLKLNSSGQYQWHTFYGSYGLWEYHNQYGIDYAYGIAVDGSGNVYVTGGSDGTWQGDEGANPLHPHSGGYPCIYAPCNSDIVVLKLNSSGQYQWHTFYGTLGLRSDVGNHIAVDGSGNVYVTGASNAGWQGDGGANPLHGWGGMVILKLNSSGQYQWHTFYGGESGYRIAVNGSGNVYVTGYSSWSWQGDGGATPLHAHSGSDDIVVLKLNSSGEYQWHTFYGSGFDDRGTGIAVDGSGNIYMTGHSNGTWQGDGNADPLHAHSGGSDIVIGVLSVSINPDDATPPAVTITSHTDGQHVSTLNITLSGTASDSGRGDNAIRQVTVNGVRADNDTASWSGTASWSKDLTLNPGANLITVIAYDNSPNHNAATQAITIHYDLSSTIYVSQDGLCAGNNPCYSTIQNAIASASIPSVIKITQETYSEDILLNVNQVIVLEGGWDTSFTSCSSSTIIHGAMTITQGTLLLGGAGILILE